MLRNKFISRNPKWDRLFVDNLAKLSHNASKLERLERQLIDLKTTIAQQNQQSKASDNQSETTQAKSEASETQWAKEVSQQYLRFILFLRETTDEPKQSVPCSGASVRPLLSPEFLRGHQNKRLFKQAIAVVRETLKKQREVIGNIEVRGIPERIKSYFSYRIASLSIRAGTRRDNKCLVEACQQILCELFRPPSAPTYHRKIQKDIREGIRIGEGMGISEGISIGKQGQSVEEPTVMSNLLQLD